MIVNLVSFIFFLAVFNYLRISLKDKLTVGKYDWFNKVFDSLNDTNIVKRLRYNKIFYCNHCIMFWLNTILMLVIQSLNIGFDLTLSWLVPTLVYLVGVEEEKQESSIELISSLANRVIELDTKLNNLISGLNKTIELDNE